MNKKSLADIGLACFDAGQHEEVPCITRAQFLVWRLELLRMLTRATKDEFATACKQWLKENDCE
jgi:hypothetical protein